MEYHDAKIEELVGKTFSRVVARFENTELAFLGKDSFLFHHFQSCCESVRIEEIIGDLSDLEESPILSASEESNSDEGSRPDDYAESWTWTFYKFATIKGSVTVRWLGESNGYYGESVDFSRIEN